MHVSKWFAKFHAGAFLLGDASQFGRPVEVDSDQIKKLIENNQCYIMLEIDSILKIFKAITEYHLHQVGYVYHIDVCT